MTAQIRQETETFVREARRRALGLSAGAALAAAVLALATSPLAYGFGVTALAAASALAMVAFVQWWRGARFAREVLGAIETRQPTHGLRARLARSVAWLRNIQNAGLVLGVAVIISAVRRDTELSSGAAFGIVSMLVIEQFLDHAAAERAERFGKLLETTR